jgi:3-isopropylmalate/(R)-2-methylmalate dehydratase small subunit
VLTEAKSTACSTTARHFPVSACRRSRRSRRSPTEDRSKICRFEVDSFRKYCLLNGLDEIGLTLRHADKIRAYESPAQRRAALAVPLAP